MKLLILVIVVIPIILMAGLYYFQERMIFFPQKLDPSYRFSFSGNFVERYFNTGKNVRIHALHFRIKEPTGVIFYLHGNAGSLQGWGSVTEDFTGLQYDVLMIDFRGYGKSSGKISERGLLHDALVIYDSLTKDYAEEKIIIYGRSLGTGMASYVASRNNPGKLILESPYYNLPYAARSYFPWFPSFLIRYRFRSDLYLKNTNCPVFVFHGDRDEVINVKNSHKLKECLKPGDRVFIIPGGHHNDLAQFDEYHEKLNRILNGI